jgi:hypothetical protein
MKAWGMVSTVYRCQGVAIRSPEPRGEYPGPANKIRRVEIIVVVGHYCVSENGSKSQLVVFVMAQRLREDAKAASMPSAGEMERRKGWER